MTHHPADRRLVRRLLAHDEKAFRTFFDAYFDRLYRFALGRLGHDPEAARDVTQLTLTRAVERLASYRGEAGLFTWLCTICRRQVVDYYRRERRHMSRVELIEDSEEVRGALESLDGFREPSPETGYARSQRARLIQVALDRLPAHYGDALEWKYVYGYTTREIAQRLGLGQEAAQSLLARARRAFHEAYSTLAPAADSPAPGAT